MLTSWLEMPCSLFLSLLMLFSKLSVYSSSVSATNLSNAWTNFEPMCTPDHLFLMVPAASSTSLNPGICIRLGSTHDLGLCFSSRAGVLTYADEFNRSGKEGSEDSQLGEHLLIMVAAEMSSDSSQDMLDWIERTSLISVSCLLVKCDTGEY